MNININSELITVNSHLFCEDPQKLANLAHIKVYEIPIQQRPYKWGDTKKENHIENLFIDLKDHFKQSAGNSVDNSYFAGTILLECNDSNLSIAKVIDGQQRLTTLYLLNCIDWMISRYRCINQPASYRDLEKKDRGVEFIQSESRIFNCAKAYDDEESDYIRDIFTTNEVFKLDEEKDRRELLSKRLGQSTEDFETYFDERKLKIRYREESLNEELIKVLRSLDIVFTQDEIGIEIQSDKRGEIKGSIYYKGLLAILDAVVNQVDVGRDPHETCELISNFIHRVNETCGLCALVSGNTDDSFRLFEILNSRGEGLTPFDLVKNLILEKTYKNDTIPGGSSDRFAPMWDELKSNIDSVKYFSKVRSDSQFIESIVRSEGSNINSNSYFRYISNKIHSKVSIDDQDGRHSLYYDENFDKFFYRIKRLSELLVDFSKKKNKQWESEDAFSAIQFSSFMKLIKYEWGLYVLEGANALFFYRNSENCSKTYNEVSMNAFHSSSNQDEDPLVNFIQFLGDILMKWGIYGITCGLSSKLLPGQSKRIIYLINDHIHKNENYDSAEKLDDLKKKILIEITNNIDKEMFVESLKEMVVKSKPKRDLVKIILYLIFNRHQQYEFSNAELEHIESTTPDDLESDLYFKHISRPSYINKIGNFFLIDKSLNLELSNKPVKTKLGIIEKEASNDAILSNPIFKQLFVGKKIDSNPYGIKKSFQKGKDKSKNQYDLNHTPTELFFDIRTDTLAKLAAKYICDKKKDLKGREY